MRFMKAVEFLLVLAAALAISDATTSLNWRHIDRSSSICRDASFSPCAVEITLTSVSLFEVQKWGGKHGTTVIRFLGAIKHKYH